MGRDNEHPDYSRLPEPVDPSTLSIEVPAFEDDRPQPEPLPPAGSPELVAATQIAQGSGGYSLPQTIHRTQIPVGLLIAGVPLGILTVLAILEILFTR